MVKHAASEEEPLLTAQERVERAFAAVTAAKSFTPAQKQWLERIRMHLAANLSIDRADFEEMPVLADPGGWSSANKVFNGELPDLLSALNEAVAA
jgi:type I restriction enzyme R subunit